MKERIGHPAEHLPHWKQRRTELSDNASTFRTNPRFIVSVERYIFVCFIGTPANLNQIGICAENVRMTFWSVPSNLVQGGTGENHVRKRNVTPECQHCHLTCDVTYELSKRQANF
jgi:hypothetical protein